MISCSSKSAIAFIAFLCIAGPAFSQTATAQKKPPASKSAASSAAPSPASTTATTLNDRQRALHALNRLTFGPRPGDVEAVLAKGIDEWVEDQLHPESIDDSALNNQLGAYASTRMTSKQLAQQFPSDGVIRQVIAGKRPMPTDPAQKLIYAVNVARLQQQNQAAKAAATNTADAVTKPDAAKPDAANERMAPDAIEPADAKEVTPQDQARAIADSLLAMPKNKRLESLENDPPDTLINFMNQLRGDQRDRLMADFSGPEREAARALAGPQGVVTSELQQAKIMRAVYSQRQLQEVMTDFWINHFNVFIFKDRCPYYMTAYERDVIRPKAFGKFYDLLLATAQSPAMLMYLDNWLSMGAHSQAAGKNGQNGLNENYGREVMELHTLGVDGGYSQNDVTELARVLTGWTIAQPDDGGTFLFDPKRHEPGIKTVLGQKFYEAGSDEGIRALDMLAHSPATAQFISRSIAIRFVSDDPPASLVNRMAETFKSTDGDIREVLRTMLKSPEFWSPKVYRAKLKTPLEFVISSVRASGTNVTAPDAILGVLNQMGMQPYGMAVPTGYSMKKETWETEGALLARINFATALTQGKVSGTQFEPANLITLGIVRSSESPKTKVVLAQKHTGLDFAIALIEDAILQGELSAKDEAIIQKQMQEPDVQRQLAASPENALRLVSGYVLASPDFQQR
jgi:uncharacterized protein (DUF1800 family)